MRNNSKYLLYTTTVMTSIVSVGECNDIDATAPSFVVASAEVEHNIGQIGQTASAENAEFVERNIVQIEQTDNIKNVENVDDYHSHYDKMMSNKEFKDFFDTDKATVEAKTKIVKDCAMQQWFECKVADVLRQINRHQIKKYSIERSCYVQYCKRHGIEKKVQQYIKDAKKCKSRETKKQLRRNGGTSVSDTKFIGRMLGRLKLNADYMLRRHKIMQILMDECANSIANVADRQHVMAAIMNSALCILGIYWCRDGSESISYNDAASLHNALKSVSSEYLRDIHDIAHINRGSRKDKKEKNVTFVYEHKMFYPIVAKIFAVWLKLASNNKQVDTHSIGIASDNEQANTQKEKLYISEELLAAVKDCTKEPIGDEDAKKASQPSLLQEPGRMAANYYDAAVMVNIADDLETKQQLLPSLLMDEKIFKIFNVAPEIDNDDVCDISAKQGGYEHVDLSSPTYSDTSDSNAQLTPQDNREQLIDQGASGHLHHIQPCDQLYSLSAEQPLMLDSKRPISPVGASIATMRLHDAPAGMTPEHTMLPVTPIVNNVILRFNADADVGTLVTTKVDEGSEKSGVVQADSQRDNVATADASKPDDWDDVMSSLISARKKGNEKKEEQENMKNASDNDGNGTSEQEVNSDMQTALSHVPVTRSASLAVLALQSAVSNASIISCAVPVSSGMECSYFSQLDEKDGASQDGMFDDDVESKDVDSYDGDCGDKAIPQLHDAMSSKRCCDHTGPVGHVSDANAKSSLSIVRLGSDVSAMSMIRVCSSAYKSITQCLSDQAYGIGDINVVRRSSSSPGQESRKARRTDKTRRRAVSVMCGGRQRNATFASPIGNTSISSGDYFTIASDVTVSRHDEHQKYLGTQEGREVGVSGLQDASVCATIGKSPVGHDDGRAITEELSGIECIPFKGGAQHHIGSDSIASEDDDPIQETFRMQTESGVVDYDSENGLNEMVIDATSVESAIVSKPETTVQTRLLSNDDTICRVASGYASPSITSYRLVDEQRSPSMYFGEADALRRIASCSQLHVASLGVGSCNDNDLFSDNDARSQYEVLLSPREEGDIVGERQVVNAEDISYKDIPYAVEHMQECYGAYANAQTPNNSAYDEIAVTDNDRHGVAVGNDQQYRKTMDNTLMLDVYSARSVGALQCEYNTNAFGSVAFGGRIDRHNEYEKNDIGDCAITTSEEVEAITDDVNIIDESDDKKTKKGVRRRSGKYIKKTSHRILKKPKSQYEDEDIASNSDSQDILEHEEENTTIRSKKSVVTKAIIKPKNKKNRINDNNADDIDDDEDGSIASNISLKNTAGFSSASKTAVRSRSAESVSYASSMARDREISQARIRSGAVRSSSEVIRKICAQQQQYVRRRVHKINASGRAVAKVA